MTEDVDERFALVWLVRRRPVSDTFDAVAVENLDCVVAETCEQIRELSGDGMIDAEFVYAGGWLA